MKKRGFAKGRWNGVGGKAEKGETIEAAMIRECREEITVTPVDFAKIAELKFDQFHLGRRNIMNVHVFTATRWEGEPTETEEMAPQWFQCSEIPYRQMWPDDSLWLPKILTGKKLKGKFVMDEHDEVVNYDISEVPALEEQ